MSGTLEVGELSASRQGLRLLEQSSRTAPCVVKASLGAAPSETADYDRYVLTQCGFGAARMQCGVLRLTRFAHPRVTITVITSGFAHRLSREISPSKVAGLRA
jgi:hypothetical protein